MRGRSVGICRVCDERAFARADGAGMPCEISGGQEGRQLGDQKWNEFRKSQCGPDATPAAAPAAPAALAAPKRAAASAAPGGPAVFPTAIDPKYSKQRAGRARRQTCVDQYNANKATNANGGMKWIQKGGGYYSECNRRLKGA